MFRDTRVAKFVPVTVTTVPPAIEPIDGLIAVTVGGGPTYANPLGSVAAWPSILVTTMSTAPAACAAVVQAIFVDDSKATVAAATPPMETVVPLAKFVPVIVTAVPPATGPDKGETDATVGSGPRNVKPLARVALTPSGPVITTSAGPATWGGVVPLS